MWSLARSFCEPPLRGMVDLVGPRLFGTVTHVRTTEPLVALTFDDGPHPRYTPQLLDVLERHGARATFFVLGRQAQEHAGLVRRLLHAGHVVGNHTWDHPMLTDLTPAGRRSQLDAWERVVEASSTRLFRPPFGCQTVQTCLELLFSGYRVIAWSLDAEDVTCRDPDAIASRLVREIRPGSIVLLHDANWNRPEAADRTPTIAAVGRVLAALGDRYRFVTVSELLDSGHPVQVNWFHPRYWR